MTGKDIIATIEVPLVNAITNPRMNNTNPTIISDEPVDRSLLVVVL
jgi:hypothetical protein